jgi:hypothetical protein
MFIDPIVEGAIYDRERNWIYALTKDANVALVDYEANRGKILDYTFTVDKEIITLVGDDKVSIISFDKEGNYFYSNGVDVISYQVQECYHIIKLGTYEVVLIRDYNMYKQLFDEDFIIDGNMALKVNIKKYTLLFSINSVIASIDDKILYSYEDNVISSYDILGNVQLSAVYSNYIQYALPNATVIIYPKNIDIIYKDGKNATVINSGRDVYIGPIDLTVGGINIDDILLSEKTISAFVELVHSYFK